MIKLFTDSDLDGMGCSLLAKIAFGEQVDVEYCTYRNLNYRVKKFLSNPEGINAMVYITDLSVNEENEKAFEGRYKKNKNIQMIDHHATALHFNKYEWGIVKPEYETGHKTSATSLFYDYLKEKQLITPEQSLNEFNELIRQYDTWEWEENENLVAKQLNDLFSIIGRQQFEEQMLERLTAVTDSFFFTEGETLLLEVEEKKIERYIRSKNRQLIQTFINDFCVGIVHAESYHSELGNALNKRNPHLDMIVIINVGNKSVGFRTIHDHVDVSKFASTFGGGGHPKASGCSLTPETFKTFVVDVFEMEPIKPDPEFNQYNTKESEFGTWYETSAKDIIAIHKNSDEMWTITQNNTLLEQVFESFNDAENFIKREFMASLQYDNEVLKQISTKHKISEEQLRSNFANEMTKIMTNTKES
ncbi:DHH family phosphoesterase [Bacillus sp. Marseille-P3661]|uniref:DHH family phosphoesterase n=1 Tax=Bacillus sp. Marseille-P3661 TaxID=1936234 RepID=UPI000C814C2D|nr:oligoribonuclease [Bacillus sp. Marseille-P3661]